MLKSLRVLAPAVTAAHALLLVACGPGSTPPAPAPVATLEPPYTLATVFDVMEATVAPASDAIFIRCDETVPFGSFATVVDELRQAGIQNISVVTEPITSRPRTQ